MIIPISNEILDSFVLQNHEFLVYNDLYEEISGKQEYRLYSYLSTFFSNITILDIGTYHGRSAIALSHNETNQVISYDIIDTISKPNHKIYSKKNIVFNIKNVLDDLTEEFLQGVKIVMIDIDHLEVVERKILQKLKQLKFSGLVILDDITNHPDPVVKESMDRLWRSIKDTKYDFTKYGHWSGTGIVVMNSDITFAGLKSS
jgi:predicted O-methyltransferase YrrM